MADTTVSQPIPRLRQVGNSFRCFPVSTQLVAGNIQNRFQEWVQITDDPYVLSIVSEGVKLDFVPNPDLSYSMPVHNFSVAEKNAIRGVFES